MGQPCLGLDLKRPIWFSASERQGVFYAASAGSFKSLISRATSLRRAIKPWRCYGLLADGGLRAAKSLAKKLSGELPRNFNPADFTAHDVRRCRWQYLGDEKAVEAAIDWLEGKGWLHRRDVYSGSLGGRPTERYMLNPVIRKPKGVKEDDDRKRQGQTV